MKLGRPNIYVEIVRKLGGRATLQEIYDYGKKHRLIRCEFSGCTAAIYANLRKKNLFGNIRETVYLPSVLIDKIRRIEKCFEMFS